MYSSWDEASGSLVSELEKVVVLPPSKRAYLRSILVRALRVDTNNTLTRTDFLTSERIARALKDALGDQSLVIHIKLLFPRTWKVLENCK